MNLAVLERVRIVLSHTSHPGNIGAAARAMKTMGLGALYLVEPKRFPDRDAIAMASGALNVFTDAKLCASVEEALAQTTLALALTARPREIGPEALDPRQAARLAVDAARDGPVAFLFGNEESGLTNAEIQRCQRIVEIPANPAYASLNVAAAVQLMAYELRLAAIATADDAAESGRAKPVIARYPSATFEELEGFFAHLERALGDSGFLDRDNPKRLMDRLRRLYSRARLEREEVGILRGMLNTLEDFVRRANGPKH